MTNIETIQGQAFVEDLCERTLRTVRVNTEHSTEYLVDLANQANVEASTMREYRGRYVFELLQNANDAIRDARENSEVFARGKYRVRIQLTEQALIIANDGIPFLEKDVDSIYRWGESSKDPNKSVGYKGIGFKSVLEITESPQIFSPVVQFHFDRATCYARIRKIVGKKPELKLPVTRFVFPFSVEKVELSDRALVNNLLNEQGYSTVIRLPLLKGVKPEDVLKRIEQDLDPALLLFLNGIDEIEVWIYSKHTRTLTREITPTESSDGICKDVTLMENDVVVSRWLLFDAPKRPIDIEADLEQIRDNAWSRVKKVGYAVAFPLDNDGKFKIDVERSNLFVYFPTQVNSGLRYRIHADFFIDAARKTIQSLHYNTWLAGQIANFMSGVVIPELLKRFSENIDIIHILVPEIRSDFAGDLQSLISKTLADTSFVEDAHSKFTSPSKLLLIPDGLQGRIADFHSYFPENELLRLKRGRQFPMAKLYDYSECIYFLLSLGAQRLSFEDVFKIFDRVHPVTNPVDYQGFYDFLWNWHEKQPDHSSRQAFSRRLSETNFIITSNGKWIRPHDALYHAKLRFETPDMPSRIRVELVHPSAYGDKGTSSTTYQLLSSLIPKARDYDAAEIIRSAIMPLFEKGKGNFLKFSVEERAEIYRYLFGYWKGQRSGDTDVEKAVKRVLVPVQIPPDRRTQTWKPAGETYLSSFWSQDDRLEQLYDNLGCAFLYKVAGLEVSDSNRAQWAQFWRWLGVSTIPRFLISENDPDRPIDWYALERNHVHSESHAWKDYIKWAGKEFFFCKLHGRSHRYLTRSVTIDKLHELLELRDSNRMTLLYQFIAENWLWISAETKARVTCKSRSGRQVENILPYWQYILQTSSWIPASTNVDGDKLEWKYYRPDQCWLIASSEDPVVRSLLPSPYEKISNLSDRQFAKDIGMRALDDAGLKELVDILQNLPIHYPDPNISVSAGKRSVKRALSALTRWVIGRINNILIQSETRPPPIPSIKLIVQDGNSLRYAEPNEPVFYADDRYHSPRWREHLPFAPLDDDWRDAAKYLGLKFVSEYVQEDVSPGDIMPEETDRLAKRFKTARPFMMALVSDQRESAKDETARYLSRLEIQVVKELAVQRKISFDPGKTIEDFKARIFLKEESGIRAGSSGRAPRTGVLYVHKDVVENFDLMGGPIAAYIRIPGLSDAFVILMDRGDTNGRLRYLQTRGLDEIIVEEMRALLRRSGSSDEDDISQNKQKSKDLDQALLDSLKNDHRENQPEEPDNKKTGEIPTDGLPDKSEPEQKQESIPEFPPLNLAEVKAINVNENANPAVGSENKGKRGGGFSRPFWESDQKLRDAYGKRGEELAYLWEVQRLKALNIDDAEHNVKWMRQEGQLTADHDLESFDIINDQIVPIKIEVKSTPGADFKVFMSREELECALRAGENYRLYRVIHVRDAAPQIYLFENPYTLWKQGKAIIEPRDTTVSLPDPVEFEILRLI